MKRVWWNLFIFTLGANLTSPLFPLYQSRFHLNDASITLLFAIYAVFLFPALLVLGPLADSWGRKSVVVSMAALMACASLIFAFATSTPMIFTARALQGLATGGFLGTCTAFLIDQVELRQRHIALTVASITPMLGFGLGPLLAGLLIQYVHTWSPYQSPFLFHIILMLPALILLLTVREVRPTQKQRRLHISLGIPRELRRPFFGFITPSAFIYFALNGAVVALIPTFIVTILAVKNLAVSGAAIFLLMLAGGLAQLATRAADLLTVTRWGLVLTILGAFVMLGAAPTHSAIPLFLGMIIEGIGNGWTFQGSLGLAGEISKPSTHARLLSSYYFAGYIGFSLPVFAVGLLATSIGLTAAFLALTVLLTFGGIAILASSKYTMQITRT